MRSWKFATPLFALSSTVVLSSLGLAGCGEDASQTKLNPEGPPMVRQVFVEERVMSGTTMVERVGMAFGTHPDFTTEEDDSMVTQAIAFSNVAVRVILDELVVGYAIEELACADGTFGRVAPDATPDDIADCSKAINPELTNCSAVCVANDGIRDEEPLGSPDGAPDPTSGRQMISYMPGVFAVQILCDGENIPLDPIASFWNPAGNQQITAGPLGIRSLGPSLVLQPTSGFRTSATCSIAFNAAVVDKDNNQVCAPPAGDIDQSCTPGDTAMISFGTESMILGQSDPGPDASNVPDVTGTGPDKEFTLIFNAAIKMDTVPTGITLVEDPAGANVTRAFTATFNEADPTEVRLQVAGGLMGDTDYELQVTATLTDLFNGPGPVSTLSFSTGAGPTIDASIPDASL